VNDQDRGPEIAIADVGREIGNANGNGGVVATVTDAAKILTVMKKRAAVGVAEEEEAEPDDVPEPVPDPET